jgi:hypothetical protein
MDPVTIAVTAGAAAGGYLLRLGYRWIKTRAEVRRMELEQHGLSERIGRATTPPTHHPDAVWASEDETLSIEEDPYPALELIDDFVMELEEVRRRSPDLPGEATAACTDCADALTDLMCGLEERSVTRSEAVQLLAEAEDHLKALGDLVVQGLSTGHGWIDSETRRLVASLIERLKTLRGVVVRMFDDAYDNISIEN